MLIFTSPTGMLQATVNWGLMYRDGVYYKEKEVVKVDLEKAVEIFEKIRDEEIKVGLIEDTKNRIKRLKEDAPPSYE